MNIVAALAPVVVYAVVLAAMWDAKSLWKCVCLLIVTCLSLTALRTAEYAKGYDRGARDFKCATYKSLVDANPARTVTIPKDC